MTGISCLRIRALAVDAWVATFVSDRVGDESWSYAFLDGVVLRDPVGQVAKLRDRAEALHADHMVPVVIVRHYEWLWGHVLPYMRAVLGRGDLVEIGWAAAVMMDDLLRTGWAVNSCPTPSLDIGTVQRHLADLLAPDGLADSIRAILTEVSVAQQLQLQIGVVKAVQPFPAGRGAGPTA